MIRTRKAALAQNRNQTQSVCAEIMFKQRDAITIRFNSIGDWDVFRWNRSVRTLGAGAPDTGIVTTRQTLVDLIHQAADSYFDDWRVSGPRPPGMIVSRLIAEVLEHVSPRENLAR